MALVTIVIGGVLIGLGVGGYLPSEQPTALIPLYFGAAIIALGLLALKDRFRKHAMHTAVLVGLVGFLGAGFMAVKKAASGHFDWAFAMQVGKGEGEGEGQVITVTGHIDLAFGMQVGMALTCAVFVALCIRSFIAARRRRQQSVP